MIFACKDSVKKLADYLMGLLLYVTSCFPLATFKFFSLTFNILIIICFGVGPFGFIFFMLPVLCDLDVCFLYQDKKDFSSQMQLNWEWGWCYRKPNRFLHWMTSQGLCSVNLESSKGEGDTVFCKLI